VILTAHGGTVTLPKDERNISQPLGTSGPLQPRSATWSSPQREARGAFGLSLTEAVTRFAIFHLAMGTILVGMATPFQFGQAVAAGRKAHCRWARSTGSPHFNRVLPAAR
jgi:hypothetical protein